MARPKRNSKVLERGKRRLESLLSIDKTLDMGNGLSVAEFSAVIDDLGAKLSAYNTALSNIDKMADDIEVAETAVRIMAEKMLMEVGSCYGRNSQEYLMAGGKRRRGGRSPRTPSSPMTPAAHDPASTLAPDTSTSDSSTKDSFTNNAESNGNGLIPTTV